MLQDGLQFLAMFLIVSGLLKITAAWLLHRNASSSLGAGIDWFLAPA